MSRRTLRVGEAVREVVSSTVLFELRDPRVKGVTVLRAEVSDDLRYAKVFVSLMGDEKQRTLSMRGLQHARGYLQKKVAERLEIRFAPILTVEIDDSVKKSIEVARLLREAMPSAATENAAKVESATEVEADSDVDELDSDLDEDDSDLDEDESIKGPTENVGLDEGRLATDRDDDSK
jgi:ribosome-binding factor A